MVSKIQLPTIEKKEEVAVTSSVIDVFYRPQTRPVSQTVGNIARSLKGLVPQLENYQDVQDNIQRTEQEAKADIDFRNENQKDFRTLVKNGTIPAGANPYYIKQYLKNSLREKAREFEVQLFDEYQKQNIDIASSPSAFNDFYKTFARDFSVKNNLEIYDTVSVAEGFIPYVEATRSNLSNQHIQGRVAKIEENQKDLLTQTVGSEITFNTDIAESDLDRALTNYPNINDFSYEQKKVLFIAQTIQKNADDLILEGMDPRDANNIIVAEVIKQAKLREDEEILAILDNIITDKESGTRLAGAYTTDIMDAMVDIEALQEARENRNYINRKRNEQDRLDLIANKFVYDKNGLMDIENSIMKYNIELDQQGLPPLTATEVEKMRAMSKAYITEQNNPTRIVTDEMKDYEINLQIELQDNPNSKETLDLIIDGMENELLTFSQGSAYLEKYNQRKNLEVGGYYSSQGYTQLFTELQRDLSVYADAAGVFPEDFQDVGNEALRRMNDLSLDLIADLNDPAFLSKHNLTTQNEKQRFLVNELRKEKDRIISIIRSATIEGMVDPEENPTTQKLIRDPNFNPYAISENTSEGTGNPYAVPVEIEQINNVTDKKAVNIRNQNQEIKKNESGFNINDLVSDLAEEDKRIKDERKKQYETGQPPEGFTQ